jgi:hypothetical protein
MLLIPMLEKLNRMVVSPGINRRMAQGRARGWTVFQQRCFFSAAVAINSTFRPANVPASAIAAAMLSVGSCTSIVPFIGRWRAHEKQSVLNSVPRGFWNRTCTALTARRRYLRALSRLKSQSRLVSTLAGQFIVTIRSTRSKASRE